MCFSPFAVDLSSIRASIASDSLSPPYAPTLPPPPPPPPVLRVSACRYVAILPESEHLARSRGMDPDAQYRFWFTQSTKTGPKTYHFQTDDLGRVYEFEETDFPVVRDTNWFKERVGVGKAQAAL